MDESNVEVNQAAPESTPVSSPASTQEKMVPQSTVDSLIKGIKAEAYQKGKSDAASSQTVSQAAPQSHPGQAPDIKKMVAEEAQSFIQGLHNEAIERQHAEEGKRIAQEFIGKLDADKSNYQDFDSKVGKLPFKDITDIITMANSVDNTAGIMYELAENPLKLASLNQLAKLNPQLAMTEMQKLSRSIQLNQAAKNVSMPNEPLSQVRPSPIGTDNGSLTLTDMKRQDWARG